MKALLALLLTPLLERAAAQDLLDRLPANEEAPVELEELTVVADSPSFRPLTLGTASIGTVRTVPPEVLQRNAQGTLGETLGWEPGVSSGYFGPGASRPVVRGFEGVRVRMLRDDLSTFDLSEVSPDHGVALEPFLLESVEIHRGPAALLYGSSAIGGAVNARSRVMAMERPARPISGGWESRYDTQGDGALGAGYLSLTGGPLVFRFTGSARDSGDISIPGRARSSAYQALEQPSVYNPATGAAEPVPNPDGTLPNSGADSFTWSAAVSYLPTDSPVKLGVSYSRFDSSYGVPYFFPGDATDLYGDYRLDLVQDRFDLAGSVKIDHGFLTKAETRLAYAAYRHAEMFMGKGKDEGRDFADTTLAKDALEGRIDLYHQVFDGRLTGVFGLTAATEDFTAHRTVFPPPDPQQVRNTFESGSTGLYALEKYQQGEWTAQLGYRLEHSRIMDRSLEQFAYLRGESGVSHSASAALAWERADILALDRLKLSGSVSRVERLPTATERYAFWNNAGIGRFLMGGDLDGTPLETEKSTGLELGLEAVKGPVTTRLTGYHYHFDNFIFLQEAVAETGGFGRAVQYIGRAATFTGFEAELDWKLHEKLTLTLMSDYVRAENTTDHEPIPRMPPLRFGSRLEWRDERFTAGLEVRHATGQHRVKPAPRPELPSDAYTLVNADASYTLPVKAQSVTVFLRATNLLNEEARLSTSFRKDVAPLPGRGLALGVRHEF